MDLETLAATISSNFSDPFLDPGAVHCQLKVFGDGAKVLSLDIGSRNVWIDEQGKCVASGTRMWSDTVDQDTPVETVGVH